MADWLTFAIALIVAPKKREGRKEGGLFRSTVGRAVISLGEESENLNKHWKKYSVVQINICGHATFAHIYLDSRTGEDSSKDKNKSGESVPSELVSTMKVMPTAGGLNERES